MFSDKECIEIFDKIITIRKFGKSITKLNHFFSNANRNKDSSCMFNFKCMVNDIVAWYLEEENITNGVDDSDKVSVMRDILEQLYCYYLIDLHDREGICADIPISDEVMQCCAEKYDELSSKVCNKTFEFKYKFSMEDINSIFESIHNSEFEKLEVLIYYNEMLSDGDYRQQRLESIDRMWSELLDFCETKEELKYIANKAMEISTN